MWIVLDCFLLNENKVTEREGKDNIGYRELEISLHVQNKCFKLYKGYGLKPIIPTKIIIPNITQFS